MAIAHFDALRVELLAAVSQLVGLGLSEALLVEDVGLVLLVEVPLDLRSCLIKEYQIDNKQVRLPYVEGAPGRPRAARSCRSGW